MSPTMTTRSAIRPAAASRGGGTGGRAGSGSGRTRGRSGDQGDGRIDGQGGQVGGQGSEVNDGVNGVPDFSTIIPQQDTVNDNIRGDVSRGCTYKEFLAFNPKEYDGKGGAIVYTCWIEKMESVQDMNGCRDSQKVKYTAGSFVVMEHAMVRASHAAYTDRFHELARLVPHLVTPEATEPKTIQKDVQIASTLTDQALRNGSIKKNLRREEMDGNLARIGIGSFDVIIGMYWLSDHKAGIICHEKVVRIPLLDGKVLRVLGEKPKEKMRPLMSAKAKEKK
ncbi:hypothetical protein Tco_0374851 [Tanacetum coccineum]